MVRSYLKYNPSHGGGVLLSPACNFMSFVNFGNFFPDTSPNGVGTNKSSSTILLMAGLRQIQFLDIRTGETLHVLRTAPQDGSMEDEGFITTLGTNDSDDLIAVGMSTGRVSLYQFDHQEQEITCSLSSTAHRYGSKIHHIAFSGQERMQANSVSSSSLMVTGGQDTFIIVWDTLSREALVRLQGHSGPITGLHLIQVPYVNATERLISTSVDGLLKIWDLEEHVCISTTVICDVAQIVTCSLYVKDIKQLLIGSRDDLIRVYSVEFKINSESEPGNKSAEEDLSGIIVSSAQSIQRRSKRPILSMFAQLCSGKIFFVHLQTADRAVELLAPRSDRKIRKRKGGKNHSEALLEKCGLFYKGSYYATNGRIVCLACLTLKSSKTATKAPAVVLGLSSNTLEIVALRDLLSEGNTTQSIDGPPKRSIHRQLSMQGHPGEITSLHTLHEDSGLITLCPQEGIRTWHFDFDSNPCRVVCNGIIPYSGLTCLATFEGIAGVAGSSSGHLVSLDFMSKTCSDMAHAHEGGVTTLCSFTLSDDTRKKRQTDESPSIPMLYTCGKDNFLRVWALDQTSAEWKEQVERAAELPDMGVNVSVDSSLKFVAVALQDTTIRVYYADSHKPFLNLYGHSYIVNSIAISDDLELLASGSVDKNIKLWGLDFGDLHRSIIAHDSYVMQVRFVPNTHYLVSVGKDGCCKLWDADTWSLIQDFPVGCTGPLNSCVVSTQGSFIACAGDDRWIQVFEKTQDLIFPHEETQRRMELALDRETAERASFELVKVGGSSSMAPIVQKTAGAVHAADRISDSLENVQMEATELHEKGSRYRVWTVIRDEIPATDLAHALKSLSLSDATKLLQLLKLLLESNVVDHWDTAWQVLIRLARAHYSNLPSQLLVSLISLMRATGSEHHQRIGQNIAALEYIKSSKVIEADI